MFLLIRCEDWISFKVVKYLHSNMFLLILEVNGEKASFKKIFTFQYVSINTQQRFQRLATKMHLHSNMFLLIQKRENLLPILEQNLHSNMFLLIPFPVSCTSPLEREFTFQYVSINTYSSTSTRFLICLFTFQYVSINT